MSSVNEVTWMAESRQQGAMRQDVAAVVLAYRPEPSILDNIAALREQVASVFVVNNSPGEPAEGVWDRLDDAAGVTVLDQDGNVGVAAGFNAGMRAALDAGVEFVWIFDQDSTVTPGMLDQLLSAHAAAGPSAGIVGPALRSAATGIIYRREAGHGSGEVDMLISSGSLFSRAVLDRIGLHDEPLFIDYVDHDICLRARKAGLRNVKAYGAVLDHRFGDSEPVRLWGRQVYLSNYSTLRHYYSARNRLIVVRRYGFGRWFWEDLGYTTKAWIKVLLLEKNRPAKISAFLRGVRDGVSYRADVRSTG